MGGSVNRMTVIGNLGQDPELRYTADGTAVCNLSVATSEHWKDASGKPQERTEWHRVNVWGQLAEQCVKYLAKGRKVYVEGPLHTREWEDRDGNKRESREIRAFQVQFLDPRTESSGDGSPAAQSNAGRAGSNRQAATPDHKDIPF